MYGDFQINFRQTVNWPFCEEAAEAAAAAAEAAAAESDSSISLVSLAIISEDELLDPVVKSPVFAVFDLLDVLDAAVETALWSKKAPELVTSRGPRFLM